MESPVEVLEKLTKLILSGMFFFGALYLKAYIYWLQMSLKKLVFLDFVTLVISKVIAIWCYIYYYPENNFFTGIL